MISKKPLVANVMTTRPTFVTVDASLEEADLVLRATIITGLPVVDGAGALVGVISHGNLAEYRFGRHQAEATRAGSASVKT